MMAFALPCAQLREELTAAHTATAEARHDLHNCLNRHASAGPQFRRCIAAFAVRPSKKLRVQKHMLLLSPMVSISAMPDSYQSCVVSTKQVSGHGKEANDQW